MTENNLLSLSEDLIQAHEFFKPHLTQSSNDINYSTFNIEDFSNICSIMGNFKEEMMAIYQKEHEIMLKSMAFLSTDLMSLFDNKELNNEDYVDLAGEIRLFFKKENYLILNNETLCYLVEVNAHLVNVYCINKNDPNNDIIKILDCINIKSSTEFIEEQLSQYKIISFSSEFALGKPIEIAYIFNKMEDSIQYISKEYNLFNDNKKINPQELIDIHNVLLLSSEYSWVDDTLYLFNKIYGIDFSFFNEFTEDENNLNSYYLIYDAPLLLTYDKNISAEWLSCIDRTIEYTKNYFENHIDNKKTNIHLINTAKTNLENIISYREKHDQ